VRRGAAGNSNAPASALEKLAADKGEYVRSVAAGNPNAPASALEKLAADKGEYVRSVAAGNPNAPASLLEKLAADKDESVRKVATENPNFPNLILEKMAEAQDDAFKITVEQINNWANTSGKLAQGTANYLSVIEQEREMGTFTGVGENPSKIDGYIDWVNKTGRDIAWDFPDSLNDFLAALEQIKWIESEDESNISYDEMEFSSSRGINSTQFNVNGKEITKYDEFEGGGDTEVIYLESEYEPTAITITYENGQKVVFDRTGTDNWTVKIALEPSKNVPDYRAVLMLVRTLLGK
jgi:hypothetical protein